MFSKGSALPSERESLSLFWVRPAAVRPPRCVLSRDWKRRTGGQVFLDGKDVTSLAPEARDVNTVFQNYALFPHMNVADNIGYGLKLKKTPKEEIRRKVKKMLELVQLPDTKRESLPSFPEARSRGWQSPGLL